VPRSAAAAVSAVLVSAEARRVFPMSGVFLQAAGILIREGLEAILVIAALAVYLIKVGANARLPALYGGAGVAVLASIGLLGCSSVSTAEPTTISWKA
jgi:high-affinity Fe2+/Pb2+ permease